MASKNKKQKAQNTLYTNGGMTFDRHSKGFTFYCARQRNRLKREMQKQISEESE